MRMLKKTKKGVTLVELVICCAIIVMLGGACTAVLVSGSTIFNQSSRTAGAQLDADVLQTNMINILPSAENVKVIKQLEAKDADAGITLFLNNEGVFTIRSNGTDTIIRSVTSFSYKVVRAGANNSTTAKAQFQYTVGFDDGFTYSGGFVMNNVRFTDSINFVGSLGKNSTDNALHFNYPADDSETPTEAS